MHKDFHLHGTYLAARLAGYKEEDAKSIACAAQAVDDITYGEYGSCMSTEIMGENKPVEIMQTLWTTFHFLPAGNKTLEHFYITGPHGIFYDDLKTNLVNGLENATTSESNAIAGVTMHVLADTYAHEGFSGVVSQNNTVKDVKFHIGKKAVDLELFGSRAHVPTIVTLLPKVRLPKFIDKIMLGLPNFADLKITLAKIGHGTAGHLPDISWLEYSYIHPCVSAGVILERKNPSLFLEAFKKMVNVLSAARGYEIELSQANTDILCDHFTDVQVTHIANYMTTKSDDEFGEDKDTTMAVLQDKNLFVLQDACSAAELIEEYENYLSNLNNVITANANEPEYLRLVGTPFGKATLWHRSNVMERLWSIKPGFPHAL